MNVLIAPDKFKGSLTADQVCNAIEVALKNSATTLHITKQPLADGGDGTLDVLLSIENWQTHTIQTQDPLGRKVTARYLSHNEEVFIELAEASGITRLHSSELDVMTATTIGTGIIFKHALDQGMKKIILGLGGSCTTEMGLGIAYALGFQFLDKNGDEIIPSGGKLLDIAQINPPITSQPFELTILCDIENPLYGPQGAAYVFGPQKGASAEQVITLDKGLKHISDLIKSQLSKDISTTKGGGSAGGIAAGLMGLIPNTKLMSGFDYLSHKLNLSNKVQQADLVISGEGKLDQTSLNGKLIGRLSILCKQNNVPLDIICGISSLDQEDQQKHAIRNIYQVANEAKTQEDAIKHALQYIESMEIKM